MKVAATLLFILTFAGCAAPVIMLKNEQTGQVARCGGGTGGSTAGGMIGYSIEKNADETCAKDYEARGFKRVAQ